MSLPRVVLSHSGIQYTYPLALALQEMGALEKFYGTLCYHDRYWLIKILKSFPTVFGRVLKQLERRQYSQLYSEALVIHSWPEIRARLLRFLSGRNYFTHNVLQHYQCRQFDAYVSTQLDRLTFDVFIGLSGSTLHSLRRAKQLGKIAIVDQHDIHYQLAAKLLSGELEACPELKETIPYWPPYQPYLDVVREEIEIADFILVPSTFALESHFDAGIPREKLILMLHAVEPPYEVLCDRRVSDKTFRILFVGTITQRKGIKYLLEAVKQLNQPNIELTLLGDAHGDVRDFLASYQPYFKWVDYVPHGELKSYFEKSDVVVLPTIYDAFGLSALEAMAAGRPVIVSQNCAAGSDVVRDGIDGYIVPIRDVEILKDRLTRLYHNDELKEIMGRNASARVKTFGWQTYRKKLNSFLVSIKDHVSKKETLDSESELLQSNSSPLAGEE